MKKYFKIFVLAIVAIIITGCGTKESSDVVKTCTLSTNDVINGYKLDSEYKIYGKGDVAQKVTTTETITSDSKEILDYFESTLKTTYATMNQTYGGYTNTVTNNGEKVVSTTTIDYNKMDLDQYVKDQPSMKSYVNSDNKMLVNGITLLYEALGATCK